MAKKSISNLDLATTDKFVTGQPVTFHYMHFMEPAPKRNRNLLDQFQQDLEPAGFYVIEDESKGRNPLAPGWISGLMTFKSPLVLKFNTERFGLYDDQSWKVRLSHYYGGKTGASLSKAILKDGYTAVVTVRSWGSGEIVDLTRFRPGKKAL